MYYLSREQARTWRELANTALGGDWFDPSVLADQPSSLRPALCYYLGTTLLDDGRVEEATRWLQLGAEIEPIRANAYLLDYLERNNGVLAAVQPSFSDPRPWAHFSSLPHLKSAREVLLSFCESSLPESEAPLRLMDIGCGNGALTVALMKRLLDSGRAPRIGEVLLMDPSHEMLAVATAQVVEAFPEVKVTGVEGTLEAASSDLPKGYGLALCALSVHHMPYEQKTVHIGALCEAADNVVIFELGANRRHPRPVLSRACFLGLPDVRSVARVYLRATRSPDVQQACADIFVMSETVSLLTEPRGTRTEYHMRRKQWHELLESVCPPEMTCLGETTCYRDEHCELVALHYGR